MKKPLAFVADDCNTMLLIVKRALSNGGIDIRSFNNGKELITALRSAKKKPNIIILDQIMPEMEGLETMKVLSGNTGTQFHIPTILMTAYSSIPLAVEFMKAGGHDFIQKPVDPEYLLLKVQNLLKYAEVAEYERQTRIKREKEDLKSAFFSNVSHEIRTPMHAITAFAKFAEDDIVSGNIPAALDSVKEIASGANKLMRIVNDLLDLSKIESGRMEFVFDRNDIHRCVQEVIFELSAMAEGKGVRLVPYFQDSESSWLDFDYGRIVQVVRNLVTNAIKFCEQNTEVSIRVSSERKYLSVSVENIGVPIAKNERRMIFEKFFRSCDDKKNASVAGTGLGLPICREIVSAHGGSINVRCFRGITFFRFSIPIKRIH